MIFPQQRNKIYTETFIIYLMMMFNFVFIITQQKNFFLLNDYQVIIIKFLKSNSIILAAELFFLFLSMFRPKIIHFFFFTLGLHLAKCFYDIMILDFNRSVILSWILIFSVFCLFWFAWKLELENPIYNPKVKNHFLNYINFLIPIQIEIVNHSISPKLVKGHLTNFGINSCFIILSNQNNEKENKSEILSQFKRSIVSFIKEKILFFFRRNKAKILIKTHYMGQDFQFEGQIYTKSTFPNGFGIQFNKKLQSWQYFYSIIHSQGLNRS
jgi:hypothetical protein